MISVLPPPQKIETTRKNLKNSAVAQRVTLGWAYHLASLLEHKPRRLSSLWIKHSRGECVGEGFEVQLHEVNTWSEILNLWGCTTLG